jgi:hypothetical protein
MSRFQPGQRAQCILGVRYRLTMELSSAFVDPSSGADILRLGVSGAVCSGLLVASALSVSVFSGTGSSNELRLESRSCGSSFVFATRIPASIDAGQVSAKLASLSKAPGAIAILEPALAGDGAHSREFVLRVMPMRRHKREKQVVCDASYPNFDDNGVRRNASLRVAASISGCVNKERTPCSACPKLRAACSA